MTPSRIVLVGPMGAGKTTIGKALAGLLNLPFFDSDRVIEDRTGADIPWIFDVEGEAGFRQRESVVLKDLLEQDRGVIATGGGIVMLEANRLLLLRNPPVVFLTATLQQLVERTSKDKKRPLLQVENPVARIRELMELRDPLYREVATLVVTTDRRGPRHVARNIVSSLGAS